MHPYRRRDCRRRWTSTGHWAPKLIEIDMPHFDYAIGAYYVIATAEASSNLARFDGVHYGYRSQQAQDYIEVYSKSRDEAFGQEVKRRIMLGHLCTLQRVLRCLLSEGPESTKPDSQRFYEGI